jgi:hypothetical protein
MRDLENGHQRNSALEQCWRSNHYHKFSIFFLYSLLESTATIIQVQGLKKWLIWNEK